MVSTGYSAGGKTSHSEAVDLASTGKSCSAIPYFVHATRGATGGFLNNKAIICGGGSNSKCYTITRVSVDFFTNMLHSRDYVAGIVVNDKLWLTGGNCLQSTEYVSGILLLKLLKESAKIIF